MKVFIQQFFLCLLWRHPDVVNDVICRHMTAQTGTDRHRPAPTGTNRHRHLPTQTGPDRTGPPQDRHRPAQVVLCRGGTLV
jgi:hypothetical protein